MQAIGLHRSVENDVLSTECEDSAGISFSTKQYIPSGMVIDLFQNLKSTTGVRREVVSDGGLPPKLVFR
ncbi:MAG: hypothetical protein LBQ66_11190 [Planctomycetaceae bacterium]|nr:hypothetical protein [Planctomycetaceae bacterium]